MSSYLKYKYHKLMFMVFVFLYLIQICKGQPNLVPNSSFEIFTSCPTGGSQIYLALPWCSSNNSTDYFNACSLTYGCGVPGLGNGDHFQYANSGSAYAGLWAYNGVNNNYREYLQVILTDSLRYGNCYYVKFYTNHWGIDIKYAVNNIACSFSNNVVNNPGSDNNVLSLIPYIYKLGNPIINDTLNWVKISGIYQATGGEQYIVIGNFKDDSHSDTLNTGGTYAGAYYFIDDVSVIPIDSINMPAFAGNDVAINLGDSVFIGQEITNLNCNWYILGGAQIANNVSGLYVKPTVTTYYVVEQNLCGNISYDTVKVKVIQTGIIETKNEDFDALVYPNPSNGSIFISVSGINGNNLNIELIDLSGRVIYYGKITISDGFGFIKTDAKNGIYTVKITDLNTQKSIFRKIVIQK